MRLQCKEVSFHLMVIWTSCYTSRSTCNTSLIVLLFLTLGMSTMKENKEKEVVGEESHPETQSQVRPSARDKRKRLSKNLDKPKNGRPKQPSPTFLHFNRPSRYMI